jgi:hypothetical protein
VRKFSSDDDRNCRSTPRRIGSGQIVADSGDTPASASPGVSRTGLV